MIANLGYTLTFGAHDHTILARSLITDIALPLAPHGEGYQESLKPADYDA